MSKNSVIAAALILVTGGAIVVSAPAGGGQGSAIVRLQSTTPGVTQTGNIAVSGVITAGTLIVESSSQGSPLRVIAPLRLGEMLDQSHALSDGGTTPPSKVFAVGLYGRLTRVSFTTQFADCGLTTPIVRLYRGNGSGGELVLQDANPHVAGLPDGVYKVTITPNVAVVPGEIFTCQLETTTCGFIEYIGFGSVFNTYVSDVLDYPAITVNATGSVGVGTDVPEVAMDVRGVVRAERKEFRIEHPLDARKELIHASIESDSMKNLYDGMVTLDRNGQAVVVLPDWFEALNKDLCYQLTCIGGQAPVYVSSEVRGNRFAIAGGKLGLKVSWQVTGTRHDKWAEENPMAVETARQVTHKRP